MPLPWPAALLPGGADRGLRRWPLAASCVGGWLGARLATDRTPSLRGAAVAGAVAIFALTGYGLISERVVRPARDGHGRRRRADRARRRRGRELVHRHLVAGRRAGREPARARSRRASTARREPIPLDGEWKTMIRLHSGPHAQRAAGLPARRPGDPRRGHPGRRPRSRATSGPSSSCSSASARPAWPGWLWAVAYGVVLAIALAFLVALAWGVHRVSLAPGRATRSPARWTAEREHVDQQRDGDRGDQHREPAAQQ